MLFCFYSQDKDLLQMNYWLDVDHSMALGQVLITYNFANKPAPKLVTHFLGQFFCLPNKR